ncbi:MAG: HAMP domain-containing histidine kinase [Magnetovibrio sp.]|nr:HAMP domain-containing histidine kinase [Magnetovibrio sp.]
MSNSSNAKETLKAAQTALEEAIDRQSILLNQHHQNISEIVHDIKNPLTAMIGYLSLMHNEVAGPMKNKTYAGYIKTLDTSAGRLLGICNALLDEHTQVGGTAKAKKVVDVGGLMDEIRDLFAAQAKERDIELEANVPDQFPNLEADPQDIYRAMTNLVSNALKFTPRGGKVEIQAEVDAKDNTFIMVVRDSGVGMTQEQIQQVIHTQLTTVSPHGDIGTGQGLGIVNRIVLGLGGKLDIVSTENRGTRIKMRFPRSISIQNVQQIFVHEG